MRGNHGDADLDQWGGGPFQELTLDDRAGFQASSQIGRAELVLFLRLFTSSIRRVPRKLLVLGLREPGLNRPG